jgi:type VI secretion system protein ImpK
MSESGDDRSRPPADGTVLRPRPGAGRRGSGTYSPSPAGPAPQTFSAPRVEALPVESRDSLGTGLSPLVQAASPLLLLGQRLRTTLTLMDVGGLRRQVLEDLRRFEEQARRLGVSSELLTAARYALCAMLDEAVLSTPWGAQSDWAQQTLLVALHREAWGGEKFFDMLDRISGDPARYIELMELQYLCMALGFAGKFQVQQGGHARLAEVQNGLYQKIRAFRGVSRNELSLQWQGLEDRRNRIVRYVPWWVVGATGLAIVTIVFVVCLALLSNASAPVQQSLAKVGLEAFTAPVAPTPAAGPTLATLLAPESARGTLIVEEQGGRTLVTLVAPELFASASSVVNPQYLDLLKTVAAAIDRVPGRVLIVGHTDDQPVRSLRYKDNFDLSRERAVSVAKLLKAALHDPARLQWTGVGDSQPRFLPPSTPENRARNRRVEIVHVSEASGAPMATNGR